MKKSILTKHRELNRSKYNKVDKTVFPKPAEEEYFILQTGWRRKKPKQP